MTTLAQVTANRENAKLSTGPKSDAGRARVSQNACKHGLSAQLRSMPVNLKDEDFKEFQHLRLEIRVDLAPARAMQEALCDQVAYAEWKLRRIARWETEILNASLDGQTAACQHLFGETPAKALDRLHRYEGQVRRGMHQDLRALGRLQKEDFTNKLLAARRHEFVSNLLPTQDISDQPEADKTNPIAPESADPAPSESAPDSV